MKYKINWRYKSSLGGPWLKGDVVELDDKLAEAIQKDSPGVLSESKSKMFQNTMLAEAEFSRKTEEAKVVEPITEKEFKAVGKKSGK